MIEYKDKERQLYEEIKEIEHVLTATRTTVMDQIKINKVLDRIAEVYPKAIFMRVYTGGCSQCLSDLQKGLIPMFERLRSLYFITEAEEVGEGFKYEEVYEEVEKPEPKKRGRRKKIS